MVVAAADRSKTVCVLVPKHQRKEGWIGTGRACYSLWIKVAGADR